MKRHGRLEAGQPLTPYPGFLAPASLKPSGDLGLILLAPDAYPGFLAPASLKPRSFQEGGHVCLGTLSGVSCPGLIEALLGCWLWVWILPYPGFLAPASLKPLVGPSKIPMAGGPYPGFLAPASLKPKMDLSARVSGFCALSGVSCPGLIEAAFHARFCRSRINLIRGFLPRPH